MNDYRVDALTTCELMPDELTRHRRPRPRPCRSSGRICPKLRRHSTDLGERLAGTAVLGVGCDRPLTAAHVRKFSTPRPTSPRARAEAGLDHPSIRADLARQYAT